MAENPAKRSGSTGEVDRRAGPRPLQGYPAPADLTWVRDRRAKTDPEAEDDARRAARKASIIARLRERLRHLDHMATVEREHGPRTYAIPAPPAGTLPRDPRLRRGASGHTDADSCWIRGGEEVRVAGYDLSAGLLYVGSGLRPVGREAFWHAEPGLIDPNLAVGRPRTRGNDLFVGYELGYERLEPPDRAVYLAWQAGGRADADSPDWCLTLFLVGLERRLLVDARRSAEARADADAILSELERLIAAYPHAQRFARHARELLATMRLPAMAEEALRRTPPRERRGVDVPLELRVALGWCAREGHPLPAEWALSWLRSSPDAYLRTPAERCPAEFGALFRRRYAERHGEGIAIPPVKARITQDYQPLNPAFGHSNGNVVRADLPEVSSSRAVVDPLRGLGRDCCDELDAFSRWQRRHPGDTGLPALALLPADLLLDHPGEELARLRAALESLAPGGEPRPIRADDLLAHWGSARRERLAKADAANLAGLLAKLRFGLEPDVRFGGPALHAGSTCVLFRLPAGAPAAPSRAYASGACLAHLAALVARADGPVAAPERRHLEERVAHEPGLTAPERGRLEARLAWLLATEELGLAGLTRSVSSLGRARREEIGAALLAVARADGRVSAGEVRALARAQRLLDLPGERLYSGLHQAATGRSSGDPPRRAGDVPAPPRDHGAVDMARVEAKVAETAAVSSLLTGIFGEDPHGQTPLAAPAAPVAAPASPIERLDAPHAAFLVALAGQTRWRRAEVDRLAAEHGVLPDGALELVNDLAFERCDAPLVEGEDPIELDQAVLAELRS